MSAYLKKMVNAFIDQRYPHDSFEDKTLAADAFAQKVLDEVEDELRAKIEREAEEEAAKNRIKELGEKTRALLLEGVLLAISLDLLVNHIFAWLENVAYGGASGTNVIALLVGLALSLIISVVIVMVICFSGIRDAIAEYHALKKA